MNIHRGMLSAFSIVLGLTACATPQPVSQKVEAPVSKEAAQVAQQAAAKSMAPRLKRKIGIGRFTNETRYGRTFLRDSDADPLGKQASDMLASRLVESAAFLVFERPDLEKLYREQALAGNPNLVGVDTLVLGSVTEFGRNTVGQSGFFSSTKRQVAHAKVEIRLVDPKTGHVFFSAIGQGEATNEASDVFGYGSRADYDATLNDKAIGAAVSDVMNSLVTKLAERSWRSDILKTDGNRVFISGGARQGVKIGDRLAVMREGEKVKSAQTGFIVTLPSSQVAVLEVISLFGSEETDEGAVCQVVSGTGPTASGDFYVAELKGGV